MSEGKTSRMARFFDFIKYTWSHINFEVYVLAISLLVTHTTGDHFLIIPEIKIGTYSINIPIEVNHILVAIFSTILSSFIKRFILDKIIYFQSSLENFSISFPESVSLIKQSAADVNKIFLSLDNISTRLSSIEKSPIGNYIDAINNKRTYGLSTAVNGLLKNAILSKSNQDEIISKAEKVILVIGRHLSPDQTVIQDIKNEKDKFEDVERCLRNYPAQMRFTDIRSPSLWDLDNNLHKFTLAVVESLRGPKRNGASYIMTDLVANAIRQCIKNFDKLLINKNCALSHCRRWIGCPFLNSDLMTNSIKKEVASALFHGVCGDLEVYDDNVSRILTLLKQSKKCDEVDCPHVDSCEKPVNFEIAERLLSIDLKVKSIFDTTDLNMPNSYWPLVAQSKITEALKEKVVERTANANFPDCCRFLFWRKEYLEDEETQLRLWDYFLRVPMFLIDVDDGIFNTDKNGQSLRKYFITEGRDYIYLKKRASDVVSYYTNVHQDGSTSEKLVDLRKQQEFITNFNTILKMLSADNVQSLDKPLLATHARFLYEN